MYRVTKIFTRPSIEIPFHFELHPASDEVKRHVYYNYITTGKKLGITETYISDDGLSATQISNWGNHEDFLDFMTDAGLARLLPSSSKEYDKTHGIKFDMKAEEVADE